jgi:hypothetical protein
MLNLVHAVFYLVELLGPPLEENVIRDRRGLEALQRFGSLKMQAVIAFAKDTLRNLLRTGSVQLTGKPHGEPSRRDVTVLELQDYYLDIDASEMSYPPGGTASDFPKIRGLRVNKAELARKAAKILPKARANGVATCTAKLVQMRRDTKNRPPVRSVLQTQMREQFGVGPSQFRKAMEEAASKQPNPLWGRPGVRPKELAGK